MVSRSSNFKGSISADIKKEKDKKVEKKPSKKKGSK